MGCRDGVVNQCALQGEGTFPFSADGRGAVWEITAFFSPKKWLFQKSEGVSLNFSPVSTGVPAVQAE